MAKKPIYNVGQEPERPLATPAETLINEQNMVVYNSGLMTKLVEMLNAGDVDNARKMFSCHKTAAMEAISQYDPKLHEIMSRSDKERVNKEDYRTAKLPRAKQRGINQTGAYFMFGNPVNLTLANDPDEAKELKPAFDKFNEFLNEMYFNETLYEARRITGAETECAKLYSLAKNEDGTVEVVCQIKSNGQGDTLFPLFNQYGKLVAFAFGYYLKNTSLQVEEHFDVYTNDFVWKYKRPKVGGNGNWVVAEEKAVNPFNKIPVIYYNHEVDWEGSQERIDQLEWTDSKHADTVEYFGDPYLLVTAEVVDNNLADAKEVGKVIVMDNKDGRFEYVTPPDSADMVKDQQDSLAASIDQDTLTPDWSYKSIMGLGTLSGEAMRRANLPGYVKRTQFAVGVYNKLIRREINLVISIMCNYVYVKDSSLCKQLRQMKVNFSYTDPFIGGIEDNSTEIATMVGAGAMSIHAAVMANRYIVDKQAEEERIWEEMERKALIEARVKAQIEKENNNNNGE